MLAWLRNFQAELIKDINTPDDTKRPCMYTLRYPHTTYGWGEGYAEDYAVLDVDPDQALSAQEALGYLIYERGEDTMRDMAKNNQAGLTLLAGEIYLADQDEFLYWLAHTYDGRASVVGTRTHDTAYDARVYLTRAAAEREINTHWHRYNLRVRSYAEPLHHCPDLHKLVTLIANLDLDATTLVFNVSMHLMARKPQANEQDQNAVLGQRTTSCP